MTRRVGQLIRLRPDSREQYLELHRNVWPEVIAAISRARLTNYSIYHHADLLFSYYEYDGHDYAADMQQLAADPDVRRWWAVTDPCQQPVEPRPAGTWWAPMTEVFHAD